MTSRARYISAPFGPCFSAIHKTGINHREACCAHMPSEHYGRQPTLNPAQRITPHTQRNTTQHCGSIHFGFSKQTRRCTTHGGWRGPHTRINCGCQLHPVKPDATQPKSPGWQTEVGTTDKHGQVSSALQNKRKPSVVRNHLLALVRDNLLALRKVNPPIDAQPPKAYATPP